MCVVQASLEKIVKCFKESMDVKVTKEASALMQGLAVKAPNVSLKIVNLLLEKGIGSIEVLARTSPAVIAQELHLGLVFELQVSGTSSLNY
jgi:hypothetical protein